MVGADARDGAPIPTTISALSPSGIELSSATGDAITIPWVGPDPATLFAIGESVTLTLGYGLERIEGASAIAVRIQFSSHDSAPAASPVAIEYGDAVCASGGGSVCECGYGGYEWMEHSLVASGVRIVPGTTEIVDGWSVTNVTAPRVYFHETCEAGAVPGDAAVTLIRAR